MYFAQNSSSNSLVTVIHFIDEIKNAQRQEYVDFVTELIHDARVIIHDEDLSKLISRSKGLASQIAMRHPEFILSINENALSPEQMDQFQNLLKTDVSESAL
jgi:hypothetical protein